MSALGDLFKAPDSALPSVRSMLLGLVSLVTLMLVAIAIVRWRRRRSLRRLGDTPQEALGHQSGWAKLRQGERERIGGELMDSLLQGIHGLIWKFQALAERLPPSHPVRAGMDEALQGADRILVDGRDRVLDFRAWDNADSPLLQQLKLAAEEITLDPAIHFTASAQGVERKLMPSVLGEVIAIVAEALRLAYRHSSARNIELRLFFDAGLLRVVVAHDGTDPPREAGAGSPGQWEFARMHERATAVSGELLISSDTNSTHLIDLSIEGTIAYGSGSA